jgi:hypothetical protein
MPTTMRSSSLPTWIGQRDPFSEASQFMCRVTAPSNEEGRRPTSGSSTTNTHQMIDIHSDAQQS